MILSTLLPSISPSVAGLLVGAVSGALAFVAVALVLVRNKRAKLEAADVAATPRWVGDARDLAARQILQVPPYTVLTDDVELDAVATRSFRRARRFDGTLSARALAEMGLKVGPFGETLADDGEDVDLAELDPRPAVTVAPCVILTGKKAEPKPIHPLGIIKSAPAPIVDDSPTEIGETFFDEVPNPLATAARPRIRPIAPAAPRYS